MKKYLEHLYGEEEDSDIQLEGEEVDWLNTIGENWTIMREKFEKALSELKDRKARRVDEIPEEFIKNSGENVKNVLYELVYRFYETGKIPQDFTKCIIVPIPKKVRANTCK